MIARRNATLFTAVIVVVLLLRYSSSSEPEVLDEEMSAAAKYAPKFPSLKGVHLPTFRPPAHRPPDPQKDSSSGDSKWFNNWVWLNPFSSSITLDEDRSVLPPLLERPYIFTYYQAKKDQDRDADNADAELLLAWRRAWYAQGFRPAVLGRGEALANPLYKSVQQLDLSPELQDDVSRWLAWGHMGDGLFANWHCFPMARYDDATLSSLRRGPDSEYIRSFSSAALLSGEKDSINGVIKAAIRNSTKNAKSLLQLLPEDLLKSEQTNSLAVYDSATLASHYPALTEEPTSPTEGRLEELINSHLHTAFQNSFPGGLIVLKPFAEHTTALVEPALRLARALSQCPHSIVPKSCPPNLPQCHPCDENKPMKISQPATYKNNSQAFTIGTIPHPYTLISLLQNSAEVTTRHVRRETARDEWLKEVTSEQLGRELGGGPRAVVTKKSVAEGSAIGTSLWMTVESLPAKVGQALPSRILDEFEWQLGFKIPRDSNVDANNEGDVKESMQHANPSKQGVGREYEILKQARELLKRKTNRVNIRSVAEAWNMADTEIWKFVKAYRARSIVEREKWEESEKDFLGPRPKV
ncbi:hypothetical protein BJY01DRAFT_208261 [Aspergillus pseudoustus]|uniref:Uncharacterized protein n=1 Tax=Aspergillus pseudoustus TaxID=1810923 RepID=A0ABR4KJH1_9EURO